MVNTGDVVVVLRIQKRTRSRTLFPRDGVTPNASPVRVHGWLEPSSSDLGLYILGCVCEG